MKGLYLLLLTGFVWCCFHTAGRAQNTGCFAVSIDQVAGLPGEEVQVAVRVLEDVELVSAQLGMRWDPAQMSFIQVIDVSLPTLANFFPNASTGQLVFSWFDNESNPPGIFLEAGQVLFKVRFKIQPGATGTLPIFFGTANLPSGMSFFHEFYSSDNQELSTSLIDGAVHVGLPGNWLRIDQACITPANCLGPYGGIDLDVSGGTPPYSFTWQGPAGLLNDDETLSATGAGEYAVTVIDQAGATVSGSFLLPSDVTFLSIFPLEIKQPTCLGGDGFIQVGVANGAEPYSFLWNNLYTTDALTALSAGQYSITVSDNSGCTAEASFDLYETSGFSLDSALVKPHCGQNDGSIAITATGYSAPFSYLWNTGDSGPALSDIGAGIYRVTVTNAEGCAETLDVLLETRGANDDWVHNETFYCDTVSGLATLAGIFWIAPGAVAPATITWSDGHVDVIDTVENGFYYEYAGVPPGAHVAQIGDAAGCRVFTFFQADCGALPPDSTVQACLRLQAGPAEDQPAAPGKKCVSVTAYDFTDMTRLRLALDWPAAHYAFAYLQDVQFTPFSPLDIGVFESQGALLLDWQATDDAALTLPDGDVLFRVCFAELSLPPAGAGLVFSDDFSPEARRIGGEKIGFAAFDGRFYGASQTLAAACSRSPSCENDGAGGFLFDGIWWNAAENLQLSQHGALQWQGTAADLAHLPPGAYRAQLPAAPGLLPQGALLHLPQVVPEKCVWPGDADDNNAANHHDLLYLGLAYGAAGPARPSVSVDWSGQDGLNWPQRTALRSINYKNIDTDGDGFVDAADTLAIAQNWGHVVDRSTDNPYDAPLGNQLLNAASPLGLVVDTASAGQAFELPVVLGSPALPADSLHGLAFSLFYDPAILQDDLYFQPSASWLGDPATQLIWLQRNFPEQGRLDVALTRFDGQPASGSGVIGQLFVIIEDDIFLQGPGSGEEALAPAADTLCWTPLRFGNVQAVRPDERPVALEAGEALLPIQSAGGTSATTSPENPDIAVWPNPAADFLFVDAGTEVVHEIELMSADGRLLLRRVFDQPVAGVLKVSLPAVPAELLWLKVRTEADVRVVKVKAGW